MNRTLILSLLVAAAGMGHLSSRLVNPPVELQPTTPGTPQVGNANIDGKLIASTFYATNTSSTAQMFSGQATAATGATYGGLFRASSTSGTGIRGYASASSGLTTGGDFQTDSTSGTAVRGISTGATGTTYGGFFRNSSTTGYGVYGSSTPSSGANFGGYFINSSGTGTGVFGRASAPSGNSYGGSFVANSPTGIGVYGICTATTGANFGGNFQSSSTAGVGVFGGNYATGAGDNIGVSGRSSGSTGRAVSGSAVSTSGTNFGGWFQSAGQTGRGVYGLATNVTGNSIGGYFESESPTGRGVVANLVDTTGVSYAVRGVNNNNANGFAIYSVGNLGCTGTKAFRIDHPLDPANKYLNHYCSEGPEPLNVYSGTISTDARGFAWVQLPDYFAEINKDPRYQLTVLSGGEEFVQAMVSREVSGSRFQIRTSKPAVKVSWEVKATRNDAWVRQNGAPVEVDKVEGEKGLYQHPELYEKRAELGMDYVDHPKQADAPRRTQSK